MGKGSGNLNTNNRANQMNPNNSAYQSSRGDGGSNKAGRDNRSNQLNPNNNAYRSSRQNNRNRGPGISSRGSSERKSSNRGSEIARRISDADRKKTMRVVGTGVVVGLAGLFLKNLGKK